MTPSPRNKIYAIVEGQGEQTAVPTLIGRLLAELECWTLFPSKIQPFRLKSYGAFFTEDTLERAIRYHQKFPDCAALLILLDMDDDCPQEMAFILTERIGQLQPLPFSVVVVCAKCEYEAWFLASLESIQPNSTFEDDPEAIRDAKGWLKEQFGYRPVRHQTSYTQKLDFSLARSRSRSFRRLYHAAQELVTAHQNESSVLTPRPG
jgi:hypothetical protein